MALDMPNDRALMNAVANYDREVPGKRLTQAQMVRITETAKRFIVDELHSAKARGV